LPRSGLSGGIQPEFGLIGFQSLMRLEAAKECQVPLSIVSSPRAARSTAIALTLMATAAVVLANALPAAAQRVASTPTVPVEELMKPGDLPDIAIGNADAKVTIIEYASMTCGHCANFATKVFPALKAKYIDTGKVRFISREFPLDNLAAAASMLTRCIDKSKSFDLVETLFATQSTWAAAEPLPKLLEVAKQAGFTKDTFETCLKDQKLLDQIVAARKRAGEKFQIASTPTFFINGTRLAGASQMAEFEKVIDPLLEAK
jgi:protein-disulfide isomerase